MFSFSCKRRRCNVARFAQRPAIADVPNSFARQGVVNCANFLLDKNFGKWMNVIGVHNTAFSRSAKYADKIITHKHRKTPSPISRMVAHLQIQSGYSALPLRIFATAQIWPKNRSINCPSFSRRSRWFSPTHFAGSSPPLFCPIKCGHSWSQSHIITTQKAPDSFIRNSKGFAEIDTRFPSRVSVTDRRSMLSENLSTTLLCASRISEKIIVSRHRQNPSESVILAMANRERNMLAIGPLTGG